MNKYSWTILVFFSWITLLLSAGKVSDRVLWKEDFSRFSSGSHPGCYHDGKGEVLVEDGRHFYRFPGGFMLGNGWNYYGSRHWRNYLLRFQLRFSEMASLYLVVKREGWRQQFKYLWYYVTITPGQVTVKAHNLTGTTEELPPARIEPVLKTNQWYDFEVKVTEKRIEVSLAEGRDRRVLWDHEVLPGGGGIDFHGSKGLDLASIEVEELEPEK